MPEPNGPWRLLYKNDSNVNTVLGVMGDIASSAYRLKQARWKARARAAGKVSFIAEKNIYKNIPQDNSNFGTSESAIFWQGFRFNKVIQAVDTSTDTFTVSGDATNDFEEGGAVEVNGSSRTDDGTIYKVQSPSDVTYDSNNDKTDITVVEDVTDSTVDGNLEGYENIFRGFAQNQGKITENGNVKFTLFSFLKRISQENVSIDSQDDIQDVMDKLTPNKYTFDSPASSNVTYVDSSGTTQTGYAPVDDYTLTDSDRAVGFREKIRNYGYVVKLKAHKELRFEPVGFGSSIDTIDSPAEGDTNNTQGNWIEWVAGDTNVANLVNTVRVVNSKNGKYDSGIITNSSSVQKHGNITPRGGNPKKKSYVSSDQEAERVAQNIIRDSQNPDEGGRVKVAGRYTNDVTNSTFTLNDSVRGIDNETFVAWSQVNFYPENKTILEFEYENQSEKETNITDDVRAERSTVFPSSTTDVGNQSISDDTQGGSATLQRDQDAAAEGSSTDTPKELRRDPKTNIFTDGGSSEIDSSQTSETGVNGLAGSFAALGSLTATTSDGEGADFYFSVQVSYEGSNPVTAPTTVGVNHDFVLRDKTNGVDIPQSFIPLQTRHLALDSDNDGNVDFVTTETIEGVIHMPENPNGNEYELRAKPTVDVTYGSEIAFVQYDEHDHDDDIEIEDEDGNTKPDMVKSTTAEANITSQPKFTEDGTHVHTIDVTTEEEILDIINEDKTNR